MDINYSKNTIYSILRYVGYYLLWGIAFNILLFLILWYLSKWDFKQLFYNPFLSPLNGLSLWLILGAIHGWFKRKNKKKMSLKKWGRTFLYIVIFGSFIMSLQIYYVHRENTGWYDMAESGKCLNKYHSFWLIKDNQYFKNIDDCLKQQKYHEDNTYVPISYAYNNRMDNYKTELIDYDFITPKIMWILIVFILFSLIELIRRYGPIAFYKGLLNYGKYWQLGASKFHSKSFEVILFGATLNLLFLAFLPKINGYPSQQLPLFLCLAAIIATIKIYFSKTNNTLLNDIVFPRWFLFITGIAVSSLLLALLGNKIMYYLLVLSAGGFLILLKKVPAPVFKSIILVLLFLDPDWLFADDGTWPEGGLDKWFEDVAATHGAGQGRELGITVTTTVPFSELIGEGSDNGGKDDGGPLVENGDDQIDDDDENLFDDEDDNDGNDDDGDDDDDGGNSKEGDNDNDESDDQIIINRPLGEDSY